MGVVFVNNISDGLTEPRIHRTLVAAVITILNTIS